MSLLQKKIQLATASGSSDIDPRLPSACIEVVQARLEEWIGEVNWTVRIAGVKTVSSRNDSFAVSSANIWEDGDAVLILSMDDAMILRASANALGVRAEDYPETVGSFERAQGLSLSKAVLSSLTSLDTNTDASNWRFHEGDSGAWPSGIPEHFFQLSLTLENEGFGLNCDLVLYMADIPLNQELVHVTYGNVCDDPTGPVGIDHLENRLGPCRMTVHAVGERLEMNVADCVRLEIGQILKLPRISFDDVQLDLASADGPRPLTRATLGLDAGHKAVKLNAAPDSAFFAAVSYAAVDI